MCKKIFKYHLVMSKTIAFIRHPSLLFSLYPEVKNHRSYSAPSLLFLEPKYPSISLITLPQYKSRTLAAMKTKLL